MKFIYSLLLLLFSLNIFAQNTIKGIISDAENDETLIGANVYVESIGVGSITDFDGQYTFQIPDGSYDITFSYVGYQSEIRNVSVAGGETKEFNLQLKSDQFLEEVLIVADVAQDQKTPVAFSNISIKEIEEELASRDLPMVLNNTPGAYASTAGGAEGDARITLRGFDQRHIAVMIDGVPVNDMENGQVYWSNWFGLGEVTKTMQVQRGLGASKISNPSVGGTINILTKGIDSKRSTSFKVEQTIMQADFSGDMNEGLFPKKKTQYSLGFNSGRLENGWGFSFAGSFKHGTSYVDATDHRGGFYYGRIDKQLGKHMLTFSAFGAPQQRGLRQSSEDIRELNIDYAPRVFKGSDEEYELLSQYSQLRADLLANNVSEADINQNEDIQAIQGQFFEEGVHENLLEAINQFITNNDYVDTVNSVNYGVRWNQEYGDLRTWDLSESGDTTFAKKRRFNTRKNFYHKPQISLRHSWNPNEKFFLSNIVYMSIGRGGATRLDNPGQVQNDDIDGGKLTIQELYDSNASESFLREPGETGNWLLANRNDHFWTGLLSTANYSINDNFTISGGVDYRYFKGEHYREMYDAFGGEFAYDHYGAYEERIKLYEGDRYNQDYESVIQSAGLFSLFEYENERITAFVNFSTALNAYKARDNFKRIVELDSTSFIVDKLNGTNFQGNLYTFDSPEAKEISLDYVFIPTYTFKTGASYRINSKQSIFFNTGYLSKATRFVNVINTRSSDVVSAVGVNNQVFTMRNYENYENERVVAFELGYSFKSPKFSVNLNSYITRWTNKPLDFLPSIPIDPSDPESPTISVNVNGLSALHQGIEMNFSYNVNKYLNVEGLASMGDWKWNSQANYVNAAFQEVIIDPVGVYVSDAAQLQLGGQVRVEPVERLYFKLQGTWFGKNYSNFRPETLEIVAGQESIPVEDKQSWQIPNYFNLNAFAGYSFKINKTKINWRLSLINALNSLYVVDATNNGRLSGKSDNDAKSATVFFGQGITFGTSLGISF